MSDVLEVDLLVIGAGMAGLAAAGYAAQFDQSVLVVERAPDIGGSAALSEGYVWTAPSLDILLREDPEADATLGEMVVNSLDEALDWVRSLDVHVGEPLVGIRGWGVGRQIDIHAFFRTCRARVEASGGWVVTEAKTLRLLMEDRRVVGAAILQDGQEIVVRSPWTLIATGGFQADQILVRTHIRRTWDPIILRSNTFSNGEGIALAESAGGATTERMDAFYGHLMPRPLTRPLTHTDYTALAQYHSEHGILINQTGFRFVDESHGDDASTMAVTRESGERALLVCDEWIRQEQVLKAFIPGMDQGIDKFELAASAGGRRATAETIETLALMVSEWGYDARQLAQTIEVFNQRVESNPDSLPIPRLRNRRRLSSPPFVALEVQPAITFTYGGLRTDAATHVLDARGEPVAGLLVAGADAGGAYTMGYAGGLVRGLVFGIQAARTAVSSLKAGQR